MNIFSENKKIIKFSALFIIIFFLIINCYLIFQESLIFSIDVARDFFLMKEIVEVNHTMLIGARSSVMGLFHGPAWLYLNIPAFFIGHGNPIAVMLYWLLLYAIFIGLVFIITKKLFDTTSAYLASVLLSSQAAFYINQVTNPYGAVILFPVFYYFIIQYLRKNTIKNLFISFFILGFIIQFEIAFGFGILLVTLAYLIYKLKINHKLSHLLSIFILFIPLSTFIVFELKNNFLQIHGLLDFLKNSGNSGNVLTTVINRFTYAFVYGWQQFHLSELYEGFFMINTRVLNSLVGATILFAGYTATHTRKFKYKTEVTFFILLYFGFWIQTVFLNKAIEWYYYWPFVSVITTIFVILREYIPKKLFFIIFLLIVANNAFYNVKLFYKNTNETKYWKFQKELAQTIYQNEEKEFGYFINTYDQLSISPTYYAIQYLNNQFPSTTSYPFEKNKITYIVIGPYPDGKPLDNTWWMENKVKIYKLPVEKKVFTNGFVLERYELTPEELQIDPDTSIFNSTDFR